MASTTNTETVAPPPGLLATSWLSEMSEMPTNITAEVMRWYRVPGNVVVILSHRSAVAGEQEDTTNTARELCREPYEHTGVGWAVFKAHVTTSIASAPRGFRARDAIFELKRLTGLTWEELATLLSVTRRSLHLWANGRAINTVNERHVRDLLMTMRDLDRGTARENRALLLAPLRDGDMTVGDLLRDREFNNAVLLVGRGRGRAAPRPVSHEALWKPEKMSVADRLGTSADRIHTGGGRALPRRRGPHRGV
jgi:hypothetical protein